MNSADAAKTAIAANGPKRTAAKIAGKQRDRDVDVLPERHVAALAVGGDERKAQDRKRSLQPVAVGDQERPQWSRRLHEDRR